MYAACFSAALACRLLPDGLSQPVSVFEVAQATAQVRAAVLSDVSSLASAIESGGLATGTTLELALALANSSGRLPFDTARSQALDPLRFDAAAGRIFSHLPDPSVDVDSALLLAESSPAPSRRSRWRR